MNENVTSDRLIAINRIAIGQRRRTLRPETVDVLAESIREIGLLNPITVTSFRTFDASNGDEQFQLITGHHRLEACKQVGMTEIETRVVTSHDVDQRLAEIDENLCRAELNQLERAEHLKERKDLYEMKHPETRQGGTPGKAGGGKQARNENISSFAQDASERTGKTTRSIQQAVRRADKISPEVRDQVRDIDAIANNASELDALSSLDEPEQKATVQEVLNGKARSVREVIRRKEDASRTVVDHTTQSREKPEKENGQALSDSGDLQDWKRKAKEASSTVMAQKDHIRTLNKERATLKARIKELESCDPEPLPHSPTGTSVTETEAWKQRALQAEEESINLQHQLDEIKHNEHSVPSNRGAALRSLLDDMETGLNHSPGDFQPETLTGFQHRFLRMVTAIEWALRQINQPIHQEG